MENTSTGKETAEDLFFKFMDAEDCPEITHTFRRLVKLLGINAENPREFYSLLKGKLQSWRCKSLWEQLDCRANQKEYGKGKICEDTQVLIIGAGPIGLRTAIEVALLGAQVVIVEKRESFIRNNVLHLWPFLLTDFRSLGAKKFYGKFCSGSIDHISIRRLQAVLLKSALIFGAKPYTGVTFEYVIEPNSLEDGWKCKVSPDTHPVSKFEFDVLIGADGKKNVLPGFQQIEMRGTLAIGITANFVNHGSEEEANVEEISGIAYQFNPTFFDDLLEQKGIKLENIVYYKDETHYFVMTAGKASLLKRGALKEDCGQPSKLLAPCNIDHIKLLEYVTDVVKYATKGTLKNLELKMLSNNQPDIAAFDFTSIKKAEHAARIIERKGSKLLVGLVGDSLLEPFWPTGSGCARGVLSALDAAWMIRSFAQDKPPLQILSERENIYRLLSGTSAENLHKDHAKYTINPSTRYLHITHKRIREVYHLYDTDDAVNADFSVGSPQTAVNNKASRRRRISTGAKFTSSKGRKRGRASSHLAAEHGASRMRSTSGSSVENLVSPHRPLSPTQSAPLEGRVRAKTTLSSAGSDDEVFEKKTRRVRINTAASPSTARWERSSTVGSSGDELKGKRKKSAGRRKSASKEDLDNPKEGARRKKGFFGFGKSKQKRKAAEDSDHHSDKDVKLVKVKHKAEHEEAESRPNFVREDSWKRNPAGSFSRDHYTRRSARDIIREMEARSKGEVVGNGVTSNGKAVGKALDSKISQKEGAMKTENRKVEEGLKLKKEDEKKRHKEDEKKKKEEERKKKDEEKRRHEEEKKRKEENTKAKKKHEEDAKKREQANNLHNKRTTELIAQTTPTNKKSKKQRLLDEIAKISPSAKRAMPVLSKLSPELDKENEKMQENTVSSAVREAAMLLMATPLLIDGLMSKKGLDRNGSWLSTGSGRVRDVIHRYNTLNDMKPLISDMNGDLTPLKRPRDGVDGPEEKPRRLQSRNEEQDGNKNYSAPNLDDSTDGKQATPSQTKKCLQMKKTEKHLVSSPSLERLKLKLQDSQHDTPHADKDSSSPSGKPTGVDFNSPIWQKTPLVAMAETSNKSKDDEPIKIAKEKQQDSTDVKSTGETVSTPESENVVKDFSSPMWQKTPIATVKENSTENKENNKEAVNASTNNDKVTEKQPSSTKSSRRSSVPLSTGLMEEKLTNLLNNTTPQKAWEAIKYMIGIFKQIQKHPNEEKYYRIFTGRVKFRKVWAMKNAKLFLTESGWTEVGSFVIFPLSEQIEGPLLLLNKYLSIADEKRKEEQNSSRKDNHSNLRRTSSSDLAEKIMDLKEALISSRSNSYKTRKLSAEGSLKSLSLHRTVSMDEVNNLKTAEKLESTSVRKDSKYTVNEFQKEEKENKPASNLRRSVSENALFASPQNRDEYSPTFSPFTRRFSQRSVKEQETSCDLVMENPINLETVSVLSDEEEVADGHKYDTLSTEQYSGRQAIQSPRELVLEEADQLSSVLGNMLNTLGSSTDSERESDSDKDANKEPENAKVTETIPEKHRDMELESLCKTLDLLIQEDSSDSSSESGDDDITDRRRYNLRQAEAQNSAFKPPMQPTRRATQKLEKTKNLHSDETQKTKKSSMTNARLNRERVTKAKSVDIASRTSTERAQEKATGTRRSSSNIVPKTDTRTVQKSTTGRRESSIKTRTQRQREQNNSRLSETTNRKQGASNKRESSVGAKPPAAKRLASKTKSVNIERRRTRPLAAKSKSVDYQENGIKSTGQIQPKTRSGRSSSGGEDDKKPLRTRNAERTRIQPTRQGSRKGNSRTSSSSNSKRQERTSSTAADKQNKQLESSKLENASEAITGTQSSITTSNVEHSVEGDGDTIINEVTPVVEETIRSQVVPDNNETDGSSDQVEGRKVETVDERGQEDANWEFGDVNLENHVFLEDQDKSNGILDAEKEKVAQFPSQSRDCDFVQEIEQPSPEENERSSEENSTKIEHVDLKPTNRKMTLLDIGKQQSKERSKTRKEVASLSLDERKQQILKAAVSKSKSKPANKRRSILQIKSRNDGNLVKNKKETFEKPDASHKTSNVSVDEHTKRRHFRFHGRRRKSFEVSNEQLEVVPEGHEEELESTSTTIVDIPSKQAQDGRLDNGISAESKAAGKNVEKEKSRSPNKISPFQFHFTKRRGSYDLEKRASTGSMVSPQQWTSEYEF